jgi:RNA polymerase sigma-70 factor, ECF subfamily
MEQILSGFVGEPDAVTLADDGDLDRFLAGVERRALRMAELATGNRDEALDLVQEAMCRLVQNYRCRPGAEWPPLFWRILYNQLRDWQRRTSVLGRLRIWLLGSVETDDDQPDQGFNRLPAPASAEPDGQAQDQQTRLALERALRELRQRQVFLLRAWEGLDVAETARALGCSTGSIKTHYARALRKLRAQLGDHWP